MLSSPARPGPLYERLLVNDLWLGLVIASALTAFATAAWALRLRAQLRERVTLQQSSERKATERELLLRTLLDASPLAIVFYADAGRIVYTNQSAQRIFFEGEAAEGQNFLRLVASGPAQFRPALLAALDEIVGFDIAGQRQTYHFSRRIIAYGNEPHTLLLVRELTREVARHELEVLKRVVRLISHEVNNSLAPVSSLVHSARQIVKAGERLERLDRVFHTIDERAKHLADFIAGYAALARLPRPQPQEVDWEHLLTRLRALYPQANMSAKAGSRAYFDPGQMEQALINLLKNANEAGGSLADVSLEVVCLDAGGAEVRISDRGRGFSAEGLQNALLPFYTTKAGGSGVGLALVREIVDAHGGYLTLGDREGGGALVTLRLPGRSAPVDPSTRARLTLTHG